MAENPDISEDQIGPHPDLMSLDRLVGRWAVSGDAEGTVVYEWTEGASSSCSTSTSAAPRV